MKSLISVFLRAVSRILRVPSWRLTLYQPAGTYPRTRDPSIPTHQKKWVGSGQGLAVGHVQVGLDPHPADRHPRPLLDLAGDALEQRRLVLFDGLVDRRLALGEGQAREL